jgi:hypothetical protein
VDGKERNRCPVCGYEFEYLRELNLCPAHKPDDTFTPEELIGPDDDCAYDI